MAVLSWRTPLLHPHLSHRAGMPESNASLTHIFSHRVAICWSPLRPVQTSRESKLRRANRRPLPSWTVLPGRCRWRYSNETKRSKARLKYISLADPAEVSCWHCRFRWGWGRRWGVGWWRQLILTFALFNYFSYLAFFVRGLLDTRRLCISYYTVYKNLERAID